MVPPRSASGAERKLMLEIGCFWFCAGFRIPAPLMIYPPVLRGRCPKAFREGTRGVWVSSVPSMGICRGYGLRGGCGCRGDGRWIDDRGRDFVAAVAVDGVILG